jgi:hypothetical protein
MSDYLPHLLFHVGTNARLGNLTQGVAVLLSSHNVNVGLCFN